MSRSIKRGDKIKEFIIEKVETNSKDIVSVTSQHFSISRQAVNKHIRQLIDQKKIIRKGNARNIQYLLQPIVWEKVFPFAEYRDEDVVWRNEIKFHFEELPQNALSIWQHGFSEMFNNAIDHSEGTIVKIVITKTASSTEMQMLDNGVGIFTKIKNAMNLLDERHAVIELTKGKLTTDPTRHSGEGIFFSSRMYDEYIILSGEVFLSHKSDSDEDWILQNSEYAKGTIILMRLKNNTQRTTKEVFDKFSDEDSYGFTKTVVPVRLAQYGNEQLISRSQAKRLLARIEQFKTVLFDFKDVESIGQAFADEVFRVFARQHPKMVIVHVNANQAVTRMISRAVTSSESA